MGNVRELKKKEYNVWVKNLIEPLRHLKRLILSRDSDASSNRGSWITISANIHPTDYTSAGKGACRESEENFALQDDETCYFQCVIAQIYQRLIRVQASMETSVRMVIRETTENLVRNHLPGQIINQSWEKNDLKLTIIEMKEKKSGLLITYCRSLLLSSDCWWCPESSLWLF